jgi:hypothetical protein
MRWMMVGVRWNVVVAHIVLPSISSAQHSHPSHNLIKSSKDGICMYIRTDSPPPSQP